MERRENYKAVRESISHELTEVLGHEATIMVVAEQLAAAPQFR
jgi:hypothetical protein